MSLESDALMQQFRQAVYARLASSGTAPNMPPEAAIQHRSSLFMDWLVTVRKVGESDELSPDFLRHWVVADVMALRETEPGKQTIAANNMIQNSSVNVAYAEILRSVDAQIFERVKPRNTEKGSANRTWSTPLDLAGRPFLSQLPRQEQAKQNASAGKQVFVPTAANCDGNKQILPNDVHDGFAAIPSTDEAAPVTKPIDLAQVISKVLESVTYKAQPDGSVLYSIGDVAAFVDHGQQILMVPQANKNEEAILAAILLAKEKYGGAFELTGSEEFKRRAIELMLKYEIDVKLKNPQQDALRRELAKASGNARGDDAKSPITRTEAVNSEGTEVAQAPIINTVAASKKASPVEAAVESHKPVHGPLAADLIPIRALDWWSVQREAIHFWSNDEAELQNDLQQLGPKPSESQTYWLVKSGKLCDPPSDAAAYLGNVTTELPGFVSGVAPKIAYARRNKQ
jgi:hypothetical protein